MRYVLYRHEPSGALLGATLIVFDAHGRAVHRRHFAAVTADVLEVFLSGTRAELASLMVVEIPLLGEPVRERATMPMRPVAVLSFAHPLLSWLQHLAARLRLARPLPGTHATPLGRRMA